MRLQHLAPDQLVQQVAPFARTWTTTTDRQTSFLAGSDRRVLGVLREAYLRVQCHRTPRPRGTLAWRTVCVWEEREGVQGLCVGLDVSLLEVVGAGLTTCEEVGVAQEGPYPFRRSAQARYGPQGSGRSAGGSAGDEG